MGTPQLELLRRPWFAGPPATRANSAVEQWAGRTSVLSGIATSTVSTVAVESDSLIQVSWVSNVASNVAQVIKVQSQTEGAYFGMTITPAPVGVDFTIVWQIWRTRFR